MATGADYQDALGPEDVPYTTGDIMASISNGKSEEMPAKQRKLVIQAGNTFAGSTGDEAWLLISGHFNGPGAPAEDQIRKSLTNVFEYPGLDAPERTINVLLDSLGGSLDSAFKIARFLSRYAKEVNIYVPRRAKSASTLIALGASHVYLSPFGELGPLDTQIPDPRNPTTTVSALDCYQSVDYVRQFGFSTTTEGLRELVKRAGNQIALPELLSAASTFAIGSVTPMLKGVTALDFGGWGRSLKIGEQYARILLLASSFDEDRAKRIAYQLVYGYTHHPFPIDYKEAVRIGLNARMMSSDMYKGARKVVDECHDKAFIGFISKKESDAEAQAQQAESAEEADRQTGDGQVTQRPRVPTGPQANVEDRNPAPIPKLNVTEGADPQP
jgi:serine dehydrogenase proteinase